MLKGTPRADVIHAGRGDDILRGRGGNDLLCGGSGNDDLSGGEEDDALLGGAGADGLFGGTGGDELRGGSGDGDILVGGLGDDTIDGGEGRADVALFLFATGPVIADLTSGQATGEDTDALLGLEEIVGSEFDDVLTGAGDGNALSGGPGNDALIGDEGYDRLDGGPGDDDIDGGGSDDRISFAKAQSGVQLDLSAGTATGDGTDAVTAVSDVTGSAFDDRLWGDDGSNSIEAGHGDDVLEGRAGDDFLDGGSGRNTLDGGDGNDTCFVGAESTGCEGMVIVDPLYVADITEPGHGATIDNDSFTRIAGYASRALGPEIKSASIGIRQITPSGCRWWDGGRRRLTSRPCGSPLWVKARFAKNNGQGGAWSYEPKRVLPPGWYEVRLRLTLDGFGDRRDSTSNAGVAELRLT